MPKKTEDHFDQINDLIDKITSDQTFKSVTKSIANTVDNVSKEINKGINESLKKNGYDSFGEYIRSEMTDEKHTKPKETARQRIKFFETRFDYFADALNNVTYGLKYRGLYRDGHQEAINTYLHLANSYTKDLGNMQVRIAQDIKEMQVAARTEKRNKWNEGYLDGLQFINRTLQNSKLYMMNKIKKEFLLN